MFLKDTKSGDLVEILTMDSLIDPCQLSVKARFHAGEEMQEPGVFEKAGLVFPSGEALPRCWTDPDYRS